jgi:hypothetical protein
MSLASEQAAIDAAVATLVTAINSAQVTYLAANGRYWQGLISHSTIPADGGSVAADNLTAQPSDQSEDWNDFLGGSAPGSLPAALYVHTYKKPNGSQGYKIQKLFIYAAAFYSSSVDSGNDSSEAWGSTALPSGSVGLPAPTYSNVSPTSGAAAGGTAITITGTGFQSGATVTVGGNAATSVVVVSSTSITCTTAAHAAGATDIVVTNIDSKSATGSGAFTFSAGSAPSFVQYKAEGGSSSEPGAVVFSSAPTSGNLLLAFVNSNTGVATTKPSGWTELNSGGSDQNCYWKIYAGEGNSFTFTTGNVAKADRSSVILVEISGNNATPIDASNVSSTNAGAAVTTTVDNVLVISGGGDFLDTDFATVPSGFTSIVNYKVGLGGHVAAIARKVFATAGSTGTMTWSSGTYSGSRLFTVAVKP